MEYTPAEITIRLKNGEAWTEKGHTWYPASYAEAANAVEMPKSRRDEIKAEQRKFRDIDGEEFWASIGGFDPFRLMDMACPRLERYMVSLGKEARIFEAYGRFFDAFADCE